MDGCVVGWVPGAQPSGVWGAEADGSGRFSQPLDPQLLWRKLQAVDQFQGLNKCWNYRPQATSFLCPQPGPQTPTPTGPANACFSHFFSV